LSKLEHVGIRIAAVAPGIIKTPLYTENPEKLAMIDSLSDVWVEPEEVATVMVALIERDTMSSKISEAATGTQDIKISSGTILEIAKDRARTVTAYNDPGPSGAGALASNALASEEATVRLLVPGWGDLSKQNGHG
jgi:3-hydroxybutyrate dehydrogenase